MQYPRVLTIAGSDSSGGAGIQADLKTFAALGCYGMSAITALTAQNTCEVRSIHPVPPEMLREQIDAVVQDVGVCATKVGMLHGGEIIHAVADAIDRYALAPVVLDPVMVATSGAVLIDHHAIETLVRELFPRCAVVTPNLDEAALLVGKKLAGTQDMADVARVLLEKGANAVLLKGGHLQGATVTDLLLVRGEDPIWMATLRIDTPNTHGTGCTLSSAIAAHLALGASLADSVQRARDFVVQALRHGATVRTGHGSGPLNHGFAPLPMRLLQDDATAAHA